MGLSTPEKVPWGLYRQVKVLDAIRIRLLGQHKLVPFFDRDFVLI